MENNVLLTSWVLVIVSVWIVSGCLCCSRALNISWHLPTFTSWVNHRPVWPQWQSDIGAKWWLIRRRYLCRDLKETILCRRKQQVQNSEKEGCLECLKERLCTWTSRAESFVTYQLLEGWGPSGPGGPPWLGEERKVGFDFQFSEPVFSFFKWKLAGFVPELTSYSKKMWLSSYEKKRGKVSLVYLKNTK